jgi:hypothetical protein
MITRPSTPQILTDVCTELTRELMPLMTDSTAQIRLHMIITVLGNCAMRSGNEIAWMKQETADYTAYALDVADTTADHRVTGAIEAILPSEDLRLDAVAAEYSRAGTALSAALDAAMDAGLDELVARGEQLLLARITIEQQIAGGPASAGR